MHLQLAQKKARQTLRTRQMYDCNNKNPVKFSLFQLFIYSGCEPRTPGEANLITALAKNLWREDNEGNF